MREKERMREWRIGKENDCKKIGEREMKGGDGRRKGSLEVV